MIQCQYGKCLDAICEASDSKLMTSKCWCPECKEVRREVRKEIKEFNRKAWLSLKEWSS